MLIYAFLLIVLLRPSWGLLGFFTLIAAVLFVLGAVGYAQGDYLVIALVSVIETVIFYAIGALIVFLRTRKGKSKQDREIDAELARMRAESAVQTNQPPEQ